MIFGINLRRILRSVAIGIVLGLLVSIAPLLSYGYVQARLPFMIRHSYVSEIIGTEVEQRFVKDSLDYFNKLGNNQVVKFEHPGTLIARPIIIEYINEDSDKGNMGIAFVAALTCRIKIYKDYRPTILRQTIIHEYLHCLGYDHTEDPKDIMYFADTGIPQENEERYAKEVAERIK